MSDSPVIVWFRRDLRISDQPALTEAIATGRPVVCVFIWAPEEEKTWAPGAATRWWLHYSLEALNQSLEQLGSKLILRKGASKKALETLIHETGAKTIFWNRVYEPVLRTRDESIKEGLKKDGFEVRSFNSHLLFEPWEIQNQQKKPFQVFTPFWKHALLLNLEHKVLKAPKSILSPKVLPKSVTLESYELLPKIQWDTVMKAEWMPGAMGAQKSLSRFLKSAVDTYKTDRDRPDLLGTSKLSPHLHFGEVSPREAEAALDVAIKSMKDKVALASANHFLFEIGWREFAYHLLYHFSHTPDQPLRTQFEKMPWIQDKKLLKAWQRGETGYPIVDAGMRELWATGWMHNRVRMIVASFLTKDLMMSWHDGAKWFWDTLVDADLASNTLGWQWAGGCGADAAPYFRIFNPILQGEKFDPDAKYVKKWIPELKNIDASKIHKVWELNDAELHKKYPRPIVDHSFARDRALKAFASIK